VSAASISADTKDALARRSGRRAFGTRCARASRSTAQPRHAFHHASQHRRPALLEPARRPQTHRSSSERRLASGVFRRLRSNCPTAANGAEKTRSEVRPLDRDPRRVSRVRFRRGRYARIHLEFVLPGGETAERLAWMLRSTAARQRRRRERCAGSCTTRFRRIVDVLTMIGAFGAVLHLEDVRALRETKNRIHRLVNTEAANLERAAQAAASSAGSSSTSRARTDSRGSRRRCARSRSCASRIRRIARGTGRRCNPGSPSRRSEPPCGPRRLASNYGRGKASAPVTPRHAHRD